MRTSTKRWALACVCIGLVGCQTAYYETMEKFGVHKRDILVDKIEDARDDQQEVQEEFASALEEFTSVVEFNGGDLEKHYDRLNKALERSEAQAADVTASIDDVERVATALFEEWKAELEQYNSADLRRKSEAQLADTRTRYSSLMRAMRNAESKIEPVLVPFRDQVLFLKHNLNAQAIASLKNELSNIETDVGALINDMQKSINEANTFINALG
jgi:hypothetical protein